ncbi:MAG: phosphoglycerate dehydrogenase, partial [Flavobacteriales bacterium]
MAKVLFLEEVHAVLEQRLTAAGYNCVQDFDCNAEDLIRKHSSICGIVLRSRMILTGEILSALPQLKFIARSGSGLENIDL